MKIFISGGCKNGKSFFAQRLVKARQKDLLYYIATMRSSDREDDERILRHRGEREGWGFETVEQPDNIFEILSKCDPTGSFLLDSVTALLANEMFTAGAVSENAADAVISGLSRVYGAVSDIVVVSDYIFSDAERYDALTENYRAGLAKIDRFAASMSDIVLEVSFSNVIAHKGEAMYAEMF